MSRPFTILCALATFGSGLYLYQSKHQAQLLDREIARTVHDTGVATEQMKVLTAEWQVLNQPDRLQGLAQQYLQLRPTALAQYAAMADLSARLPAALPASAYAPPAAAEAPAVPPAPVALPSPAPALVASAAPRAAVRTASVAVPPAPLVPAAGTVAGVPAGSVIVTASAAPLAADRGLPEPPAARVPPRRLPEGGGARPAAPLAIGPAVAAPLAPAAPLVPRPALVQRIAANVPAPPSFAASSYAAPSFARPAYSTPGAATVSAVTFPAAPPAVTSALGMAAHGSLLPPPVPVH